MRLDRGRLARVEKQPKTYHAADVKMGQRGTRKRPIITGQTSKAAAETSFDDASMNPTTRIDGLIERCAPFGLA